MIDNKSTILIENKSKLTLSGLEEVFNISDTQICVRICGEILEIRGLELRAENFSIESGNMCVLGQINSLKYDTKHNKSFIKRIFK